MTQLIRYTSEDGQSQVQLRADRGQDVELHEESVAKASLTTAVDGKGTAS